VWSRWARAPTTSLYYEDPEGIRLELQAENFATGEATAQFLSSRDFAANPIGVNIDPDYLLERLAAGEDPAELLKPEAGTRPGTTPRANCGPSTSVPTGRSGTGTAATAW
jgi:hypothetical protein